MSDYENAAEIAGQVREVQVELDFIGKQLDALVSIARISVEIQARASAPAGSRTLERWMFQLDRAARLPKFEGASADGGQQPRKDGVE